MGVFGVCALRNCGHAGDCAGVGMIVGSGGMSVVAYSDGIGAGDMLESGICIVTTDGVGEGSWDMVGYGVTSCSGWNAAPKSI